MQEGMENDRKGTYVIKLKYLKNRKPADGWVEGWTGISNAEKCSL